MGHYSDPSFYVKEILKDVVDLIIVPTFWSKPLPWPSWEMYISRPHCWVGNKTCFGPWNVGVSDDMPVLSKVSCPSGSFQSLPWKEHILGNPLITEKWQIYGADLHLTMASNQHQLNPDLITESQKSHRYIYEKKILFVAHH